MIRSEIMKPNKKLTKVLLNLIIPTGVIFYGWDIFNLMFLIIFESFAFYCIQFIIVVLLFFKTGDERFNLLDILERFLFRSSFLLLSLFIHLFLFGLAFLILCGHFYLMYADAVPPFLEILQTRSQAWAGIGYSDEWIALLGKEPILYNIHLWRHLNFSEDGLLHVVDSQKFGFLGFVLLLQIPSFIQFFLKDLRDPAYSTDKTLHFRTFKHILTVFLIMFLFVGLDSFITINSHDSFVMYIFIFLFTIVKIIIHLKFKE